MSIWKFGPAPGPSFVAGSKETPVYKDFQRTYPLEAKLIAGEHVFGTFFPFLIGASKTTSGEWQPHPEIWSVYEDQLRAMHADGGYDKYLSHGYGIGKIVAQQLRPELYTQAGKLHATIAGRIGDIVGQEKLVIGLGTCDDGYGRETVIYKHNGTASILANYLRTKDTAFFRAHWQERLQYLQDLPVDLYCLETAHNRQEILAIANIVEQQQAQLLPMFYADKNGIIPDIQGGTTITDMIAFFEENCKDIMIGYGTNCVTREVAGTLVEQLEKTPLLLKRFIALWTNSSPHCYEHDYTSTYKESLAQFIHELLERYPHLQYVTGCCGHKDHEVKAI